MAPNIAQSGADDFAPGRKSDPVRTLDDAATSPPASAPPILKPDTVDARPPRVDSTVRSIAETLPRDAAKRISRPLPPPLPRAEGRGSRHRRWILLSAAAAVIASLAIAANRSTTDPELPRIDEQVIQEGQSLALDLKAVNHALFPNLRYSLVGQAPPTMKLAAETGLLTWTTTEWDGPSQHTVRVRVTDSDQPLVSSEATIRLAVRETPQPPRLREPSLSDLELEDGIFSLQLHARDKDIPAGEVTYGFSIEPPLTGTAAIDPATGLFTWQPAEEDFDRTYRLTFRATKEPHALLAAERHLAVTLPEPGQVIERGKGLSYERFVQVLRRMPQQLDEAIRKAHPGGDLWRLKAATSLLLIYEYDSAREARRALQKFDSNPQELAPELLSQDTPAQLYHKDRLIVLALGNHRQTLGNVRKILGPSKPLSARSEPAIR